MLMPQSHDRILELQGNPWAKEGDVCGRGRSSCGDVDSLLGEKMPLLRSYKQSPSSTSPPSGANLAASSLGPSKEALLYTSGNEQAVGDEETALTTQPTTTTTTRPWYMLPKGGVVASTFQMLTSTIGSSSLTLPFIFMQFGLVSGVAFLLLGASLTFYSYHLLVSALEATRTTSYEELVGQVLGKRMEKVVNVNIIIVSWGSAIGKLIIVGDVLPNYLRLFLGVDGHDLSYSWSSSSHPSAFLTERWFLIAAFTLVVILPLALVKNLSSLRYVSSLGFLSIFFLLFIVLFRSFERFVLATEWDVVREKVVYADFTSPALLPLLPIMFYVFSAHISVFPLYQELRPQDGARMQRILFTDCVILFFFYSALGVCGYLSFLDATQQNMLNNYPLGDILLQAASFIFTIALITSVPFFTTPCRTSVDYMLFGPSEGPHVFRDVLETLAIIFLLVFVAIAVPNITTVFGLLGGTCVMFCGHIVPALTHLKVSGASWKDPHTYISSLLIAVGLSMGLIGTASNLYLNFLR
jgi:sodium-coupled neutral amino acid transporter 11